MSRIKKQLDICPPTYMCKGPNRENFVSTGHKCGYCKGNGWFWGMDLSREHLLLANARSKELGYPGGFTKGMKFRGNQYTGRIRVE